MKKILLFLLLGLLPQLIHAQTAKAIWCNGDSILYFTYDTNTYATGGTYDGQRITEVYTVPINNYSSNAGREAIPWYNIQKSVRSVVVASNFSGFTPTSLAWWFYDFIKLTTFTGLEYINTNNVTNLNYTFTRCGQAGLTSLDLSTWNTSKVTSLYHTFEGCNKLTSLNVSTWDTGKVTNMDNTFSYCVSLPSLNIGNWNTGSVTTMDFMFHRCIELTSLDISNWDTGNVTTLWNTFASCYKLAALDINTWNTSKVTNLASTFYDCDELTSLDLSNWNTSKVTTLSSTFGYCNKLTSLDVSTWDTGNVTTLISTFAGCLALISLDVSNWDTGNVTTLQRTFEGCRNLPSLNVSGWKTGKVTNMYLTFSGCYELASVGDLRNWDTSNVTTMESMFRWCHELTTIGDVSNWNIGQVTTLNCTFESCGKLTPLDVSKWNTSNVTNMAMTFTRCSALTSLDVSKWDTRKVTTLYDTFEGLNKLTSLDVSKWNTSNVTNMASTFERCVKLTSLDVSNWDTSQVTTLSNMFWNCNSLTSLDVSKWNTNKVTSLYQAFYMCANLTSLTFGKDFSLANVTTGSNKGRIFDRCPKLRYIDFYDSDDTDAITSVRRSVYDYDDCMFYGVPETTIIYLPHGSQTVANTRNVVYSYNGDETDLRCPEYYSEDKVDIEFPRDFKTHKAIYQRTMSNNYGSVILPYDFTTNDNVQAYTLDEEHTETMYFRDTQTVPAHTPFAFNVKQKGSGNVVDFTMADSSNNFGITVNATHTTHPDEKGWDGIAGSPYTANTKLGGWTTKGYYVNQTIENTDPLYSDLHYIAGEKFYKAAGETLIFPPHRVTFHGTWTKGNTSSGAKSFVFAASSDEVITAIEEAETRQTLRDAEAIYDLAGRRQHEAQKGVNIVRMKDGSVRKMFVK